ncbi:uncharacterized protein LOC128951694 isoform X2 [Oppia nitens]|nr:uncharacterized protein LOC128951694 isoform X2 [Oppia nitens]
MSPTQSMANGSQHSVVLDCQFEMDELQDKMVVLKWYHKGDTVPIYQWIISKNSRKYSDKIEPFVDKTYLANNSVSTQFRAIRLVNPTVRLSGIYECSVQSLESHDIQTTELIIYVPAKRFTMQAIEVVNGVNITCEASGLSPEPRLTLFRITQSTEPNNNSGMNAIEVIDRVAVTLIHGQSGLYDISLTAHVYEDSYSGLDATDHYECRLTIDKTGYQDTKTVAIQAGWHTRYYTRSSSNNKFIALKQTSTSLMAVVLPLLAVLVIIINNNNNIINTFIIA